MAKNDKRIKKIFDILKVHPEGINGAFISRQLGVSSRTIRSDMKTLQELLNKYDVKIIANPANGYKFQKDIDLLNLTSKIFSKDTNKLETANERNNYIICCLLENTFLDHTITQNDLAEKMFISLSTLKSHLNEVKNLLKKYDLKIVQYKTQGIKLIGEELKLRYCIADFMNTNRLYYQKLFQDIDISQLDRIIKDVLIRKNLQLTDNAKKSLSIHVAIALLRFKFNKSISYPVSLASKIEATFEYNVAKEIVKKIYEKNNNDLSYAEVYYIAQCLLASKKVFDIGESPDKEYVKKLVDIILKEIKIKLMVDFCNDKYLIDGLILHLNIALTRIKFHMSISNELLGSIKNDYPLAFQMGIITGRILEKYDNIKISENEIGYIALHFGAALSRHNIRKSREGKNVIVVCSSGLGISTLLKSKLEEHFHERLNVIKIMPGYELTDKMLDNVDYVLSTVPLKNMQSEKIIQINHMLQKSDIKFIEDKIFQNSAKSFLLLKDFFSEENFYSNKNFKTKDECINFLTDEAIKKGLMTKKGKDSVFEREQMSSTSIGNLTAIPHPIYVGKGCSFISILVLEQPIIWDDLLVQVIFLLNIENKSDLWEYMFLELYKYIKSKNGINCILQTKSFAKFINDFSQNFV